MPAYSRGMASMALSAVAFSVMAALVKLAGPTFPNQELVALRSLASILPILAIARWRRVPFRIHSPGWLFVRGFLGYLAISCWFVSLNHLSLPDSVMIQYTSPVFVSLLAPFVLQERSMARDRWALAIALAGVALVVRPGLGLTASGALIGLAGAVCSAGAYVTIRALRHSDHPVIVMLAFPSVAAACGLLVMLVAPPFGFAAGWIWPDGRGWLLLSGIALMTAAGQVFLTYGLQHEPAGRATVATYLAVVVSVPLGVALFGQWPDLWMVLGGSMVVGAVATLSLVSHRPVPPPAGAGQMTEPLALDG
ncbi:MAG: DMT family transporter [Acidobacteria bacterium]|nr:DMT family transporter [Acidobacteriota bacterium]